MYKIINIILAFLSVTLATGCSPKAEIILENQYGSFSTSRPVFRWTVDHEDDFVFQLRLYDASKNYERVDEINTKEYEYQFDYPLEKGHYQLGLAIIEPEKYTNKSWIKIPFSIDPVYPIISSNPQNCVVYSSAGKFPIKWSPIAGADRYEVTLKNLDAGEISQKISTFNTDFPFDTLAPGQYELYVRALYPDQRVGDWSEPYFFTVIGPGEVLLTEKAAGTTETSSPIIIIGDEKIEMQLCPGGIVGFDPEESESAIVWCNALNEYMAAQTGTPADPPYIEIQGAEIYVMDNSFSSACDGSTYFNDSTYLIPNQSEHLILSKFLESELPPDEVNAIRPYFVYKDLYTFKGQIMEHTGLRLILREE